jgi:serine/threonine-protein kinase
MRVSAAGGTPEIVTTPDVSKGEHTYRWPEILPGGKTVLFVIAKAQDIGSFSESKIAAVRLDTHEKRILPIAGTFPRYSPSGYLLFERDGRVFAVQFDPQRLEVTGQAVPVLDGVKTSPNSGAADYMVSDTGSLVYLPETAYAHEGLLVWVTVSNRSKNSRLRHVTMALPTSLPTEGISPSRFLPATVVQTSGCMKSHTALSRA